MSGCALNKGLISRTMDFHGHSCPGLALGIRAAELALNELGRASDEEVVAVVETDMCGVDAIQFLLGCTFGKGNLIHRDYGKNAFSFYRRSDKKAFRITTRPEIFQRDDEGVMALRKKMVTATLSNQEENQLKKGIAHRTKRIMEASLEDLFEIKALKGPVPKKARIMESIFCQGCGEAVMESRTRRFLGQVLCIPCFEAAEKR